MSTECLINKGTGDVVQSYTSKLANISVSKKKTQFSYCSSNGTLENYSDKEK